jgi:hypothetical protein
MSGAPIPFIKNQTGSGNDGNWYFYRVSDLQTYMEETYGTNESDIIRGSKRSDFSGHTGIIQFDLRFKDATGHFTTWDGNSVGHGDYFGKAKSVYLYLFP